MTIITALFLLCLTLKSRLAQKVECQNPVRCPCGNRGDSITVCARDIAAKAICTGLLRCKKCDSELNICTECPEEFVGPFCSRGFPKKKICRDPGFVSNGFRKHTDGSDSLTRQRFEEGQSVVYACVSYEYGLQGPSLLTCKHDVVPEIMCPDPGQKANADRLNSDGSLSVAVRRFRPGQSVVYSCRPGFALKRRSLITCLASGAWSSQPPYCVRLNSSRRKVTTTTAGPIRKWNFCRDPGLRANGNRQPTQPPAKNGFPQGSLLEYFCYAGYILEGERTLFCLPSGDWSASTPICKAETQNPHTSDMTEVTYCMNPGPFSNGQVVLYPSINYRKLYTPEPTELDLWEYPERTLLVYSCNTGYTLVGNDTSICKGSGLWSAKPPTCIKDSVDVTEKIHCANPGPIPNGQVVYYRNVEDHSRHLPEVNEIDRTDYPEESLLEYSCDNGYLLEGKSTLICEVSGFWSAEPPVCREDYGKLSEKIYCINPGPVSNGQVVYYRNIEDRSRHLPEVNETDRTRYPEESLLEYSCDDGYSLIGNSTLICEVSGLWSGESPICIQDITD